MIIGSRNWRVGLLMGMGAFLTIPFVPLQAEAQDGGRFRVLVANLKPTDGTRDRFGERISERLRDILDMPTHVAMAERDTDQAARQYDLRLSNLDCTTSRQLADLLGVPLVFCGEYATEGDQIRYTGSFFTVPGGEEFTYGPELLPEGETNQAAANVLAFFGETVDRLNQISYCLQDANSQNWEGALQYCTEAVALEPGSRGARTALARTYMELERYEEALEQFEVLLEGDPYSSSVLESAGYAAVQVGENEKAFEYYSQYLELNPANVAVRARLAYDIAQAGDYEGAMELLRVGLDQNPDDVDLHEAFGSYAFRAASERQQMTPRPADASGPPPMPAEVAQLYREALRSLERVLDARGPETPRGHVHNSLRARIQLGDLDDAIEFGRRAMELFSQDAQILSLVADAHARAGNIDQAIARMEQAVEVQPGLPNAHARMAQWLLQEGEVDRAIEQVDLAIAAGEQTPDQLGMMLFGHAWNQGVQAGNREMGIRVLVAAKGLEGVSDAFLSQVNFFHGYALFQPADTALRTDTSLEASQRYLPVLREAQGYLRQGEAYARQANQNIDQILEAIDIWIETAEAVIARSGG